MTSANLKMNTIDIILEDARREAKSTGQTTEYILAVKLDAMARQVSSGMIRNKPRERE